MLGIGLLAVGVSTLILMSYLGFIWWLDRYEREPVGWVALAFVWGALGATCLGIVFSVIMDAALSVVVHEMYAEFQSAVITAPLVEEFTKGLIFLVLIFSRQLDNETDGLIYGAAVGIGFATVENLLYFAVTAEAGPGIFFFTVFMRTFFSALVHTISSALLGYTIGYVRHRKLLPLLWLWPLIGFALAVANHALWNLAATLASSGLLGEMEAAGTLGMGLLLVVVMSLIMFTLTQLSLMREQRNIKRFLAKEAEMGTLPAEHAEIIPYWLKRRKKDWLPAGFPHKEYVEAATLLAFRRYQHETAAPRAKAAYAEEVEKYRQAVRELSRSQGAPWQ